MLALVILAQPLTGCATHVASLRESVRFDTPAGRFELLFSEADGETWAQVRTAVERATPALTRWGGLPHGVTVRLVPSHAQLEREAKREGYAWLKAWARYDEVILQSPRTWSLLRAARQQEVDELVLHELSHCLMYQRAATRETWRHKEIPFWFREGMASFTARQGGRWRTLETLARHLETPGAADPLREAEKLSASDSELVYGAAHHAFSFLVRRYGDSAIRALLEGMSRGLTFPEAFEAALPLSSDAFLAEFQRFVRLRGFRMGRVRAAP